MGTVRRVVTVAVVGLLAGNGLLSLATASFAATVNVDFNNSSSPTYSGTAAAPDAGTTWNGVLCPTYPTSWTTTSSGALVNSNGGLSPVTFTLLNIGVHSSSGANVAPNLTNDYVVANTGTTLTISGLLSGTGTTYDLYMYVHPSGYGASYPSYTTFTIGGVSKTASYNNNYSTFIEGKNYARFTGLTATGGVISCTVSDTAANQGAFNGFQLVETPEPTTAVLLVSGVLGSALFLGWRRRKGGRSRGKG